MKGRRIQAYVIAIDLLAIAALIVVLPQHVEGHWVGMFLLATLVALAGSTPVRIPALKTAVSATDPFVFTALAAYGPGPACVIAAVGVLGATLGPGRDRKPMHVAFNLGNVVFSIAVASFVYRFVGGVAGGAVSQQIWPLMVSATLYFFVNTCLVTTAIVIDTDRSFLQTWRESGLWTAVSNYAGLTLAVCLLLVLDVVGPSGLALGIPPCWLLAAFYRTHKERQEEQQTRIQQIELLNTELESKVEERTEELQRAVSHIEQANKQLRLGNERLTEANRAKSEFLANVSHELRTPLNAIIGFSDLVRDTTIGELNEQQREFVGDIHESGEHLLRLINDILDLSKVEAGKMEVHLEKFRVSRAIREAAAMVRPQATQGQLEVSVECASDVRMVELDPGMFRQVLVNLLSNAVKFTPAGGKVRVIAQRRGEDLIARVEDSGIGIAPDHVQKIFHEFYQVDGSYSRNYGGTGLGLALVRRMVELQGGKISVESTVGQGTAFTCVFPGRVLDEDEETVVTPAVRDELDRGAEGGQTILVVEDNPVNLKLARNVLRSRGYRVFEATSGEEALRMLRRRPTDLVLMDIQLPGMDGLEVTRRLKADPMTAELPIVALTAHAQDEDEVKARDAGCCGYISKPIRLNQFPAQVEAYL